MNVRRVACTLLCLGLSTMAPAKEKTVGVTAGNPSAFARMHETIEIPLGRLRTMFGPVDAARLIVLPAKSADPLPTQITGDALLFQTDFRPKETKTFYLTVGKPQPPAFPSSVDGRYVLPREDYAWENDRIAFRMYGPALAREVNNGIDVWTKRVPYLIVAKWYKESESAPAGKDTYHEDRGEGADFFEVGRTLGAGGSGIWQGGKVLQPGVFSTQKTLANGPIRVSFELSYRWTIDGGSFIERKTISLDAGHYLNRIQVQFEGMLPRDSLTLVCGLVKRANTSLSTDARWCWMGLWGLTNADTTNGSLGTGVVLGRRERVAFGEDTSQYLIMAPVRAGENFVYFAGAGWSRNSDFSSAADWSLSLKQKAQSLIEPIVLRYKVLR